MEEPVITADYEAQENARAARDYLPTLINYFKDADVDEEEKESHIQTLEYIYTVMKNHHRNMMHAYAYHHKGNKK